MYLRVHGIVGSRRHPAAETGRTIRSRWTLSMVITGNIAPAVHLDDELQEPMSHPPAAGGPAGSMTPAFVLLSVWRGLSSLSGGHGASTADLVSEAILTVSVIGVIVTVAIAALQRRDLTRYRKIDQDLATRQAEQEHLRQERLAHRETWEQVFLEIQDPLVRLEDIESEVREQGPLDGYAVDTAELGKLQRRLENVSRRCPEALREPLKATAAAVQALRSVTVSSDTDVTILFTKAADGVPAGGPPPEIPARAIGATAIQQFKAASELHNAIGKAWDSVHYERGDRI
jgi:hypothetical protein